MNDPELKIDTKIKVPKTPEDQLKQLIDAVNQTFELLGPQKSDPLVQLHRDGQLNFDFIMREAELMSQKKSSVSAGKRAAISCLVKTAVNQFRQNQSATTTQHSKDEHINS